MKTSKNHSTKQDINVAAKTSLLLGMAIAVLLYQILTKQQALKHKTNISKPSPNKIDEPDQNSHSNNEYSANIYFTLASVVQGITIAVLGETLFHHFQSISSIQPIVLLVAFDSLLIAIIFWFAFVMAYFYLYRIVNLRAKDHFALTAIYFLVGIVQLIAFQFIEQTRTWITLVSLMLLLLLLYRLYTKHLIKRQLNTNMTTKIFYAKKQPLDRVLNFISVVIFVMVGLWHFVPTLSNQYYEIATLSIFSFVLVIISISAIKSFQSRLDAFNKNVDSAV